MTRRFPRIPVPAVTICTISHQVRAQGSQSHSAAISAVLFGQPSSCKPDEYWSVGSSDGVVWFQTQQLESIPVVGSVTVDVLDLHFVLLVASPTLSSGIAVRCWHSDHLVTLHNTTRQTEILTYNFYMGIFRMLDIEETQRSKETIKLCKDNIERPGSVL